jgi:ABC-type polysaccharide/polyol phosphate export permease
MQVELPRGDYVFAALVATLIGLAVGSLTLLPAIVFFNWLGHAGVSLWPKLLLAIPLTSGMVGAWLCLRRAKSDRIRQRLLDELRD